MEGYDIPIGADFSGVQRAFAKIGEAVNKAGAQMRAAMNGAAKSSQNAKSGFAGAASTAGSLGNAVSGAADGMMFMNRAAKALRGVSLGQSLAKMVTKAGGVREAFRKIPAAMKRLAKNKALRRIVIGAGAAAAAVIGIRTAYRVARRGAKMMGRAAGLAFRGMRRAAAVTARKIRGTFRGLGKFIKGIFGGGLFKLAGIAGLAGAVALLTTQIIGAGKAATAFEDLEVGVSQFTGSVESAKALMKDLNDFSVNTPFKPMEILSPAQTLLAAGVRENVAGIVKEIAAVSSNGQTVAELADAMAKGFAKGRFQTEELNKFMNRNINLMPELEKVTGATGDEMQKLIQEGLSFDQVSQALRNMSSEGGSFFGMLDRRSQTTTGKISTLAGVWDELRRNLMQPVTDALKPIIDLAIERLRKLKEQATALGAKLRDAMLAGFVLIREGNAFQLLRVGFILAMRSAVDVLFRGLQGAVAFLTKALPPVFEAALAKLKDPLFWEGIESIFKGIANSFAATIQENLPGFGREETANQLRRAGSSQIGLGKKQLALAGRGQNFGAAVEKALLDGMNAFADAAGRGPSEGVREARAAFGKLLSSVSDQVAELRKSLKISGPKNTDPGTSKRVGDDDDEDEDDKSFGGTVAAAIRPAIMSLTRIGGGGSGAAFRPMVRAQNETNRILKNIDRKTGGSAETPVARFS